MDDRIPDKLHKLGAAEREYQKANAARDRVITDLYILVEQVCREKEKAKNE